MPNWAITQVSFWGYETDIDQVHDAFQEGTPLHILRPCPEELRDTVSGFLGAGTPEQAALEERQARNREIYGHQDWYDWCNSNWGTKWDASDIQFTVPIRYVSGSNLVKTFTVRFDTPWNPPDEFLVYLAQKYPSMEISGDYTLEEEGHDISYDFIARADTGFAITGSESLSELENDHPDTVEWEGDPPDGWTDDPSFRAVTGSATKLPLP